MARRDPAAPADADLHARLRAAGLRATQPRLAVLKALEQSRSVTHSELAEALAGSGWDRATVYRNLVALAEAGLARRVDPGDHVWRYEIADATASDEARAHPHFVCDDCGAVECLPGVSLRVGAAGDAPRAVLERSVEVQLRGRCDRCD